MWQLATYKVQWPEVWLMPFFPVQGRFFFLLPRRVAWCGLAPQDANMKRIGGPRVRHCVWQEIPFTIDLTTRTVPQRALLICPLSRHLPLCWFFVAFLPVPWRGGGVGWDTPLMNAPSHLSTSPMEESPWTMLLVALLFSACLQEAPIATLLVWLSRKMASILSSFQHLTITYGSKGKLSGSHWYYITN